MDETDLTSQPVPHSNKYSRILMPSTRDFFTEGQRIEGYSRRDFIHGYIYARWPYLYIGIGKGDHWIAKFVQQIRSFLPGRENHRCDPEQEQSTWADGYHGKVMPINTVKQLVRVREPIDAPDLEHVIPFDQARDLVMKHPEHIVALECPCRSSRENPCEPLDVCLIVGEPFASFVFEHHPKRSRWITGKEAEEILEQEHQRGHVHHAFFKDAMLGRFYAICNCCACCCGAMQAHRNGTPMLISSGFLAQVDPVYCQGCGSCIDACPFEANELVDGIASVDVSLCMGCGICEGVCEQGAIMLVRDPEKPAPLILEELASVARY